MTRQQTFMCTAIKHVNEVRTAASGDKAVMDAYGGLCHKFPVLIRTCGLCQAIAFSESKSGDDKPLKRAHKWLLEHTQAVLNEHGVPVPNGGLSKHIVNIPVAEYAHATRILLQAWVYYKRFAESVLGVTPGQETPDGG